MKKFLLIPWAILFLLLRMDRWDKDYDWSFRGSLRGPTTRFALVSGAVFWLLLAAAVVWLLVR
jgi:hypothetical protein